MLRNYRASAPIAVDHRPVPGDLSGLFSRLAALAGSWLERHRSRRDLVQLDERLLRDIGLTPAEAIEESAVPFWKPFTWI